MIYVDGLCINKRKKLNYEVSILFVVTYYTMTSRLCIIKVLYAYNAFTIDILSDKGEL